MVRRKLFCELGPVAYTISLHKERLKRHIKNMMSKETFSSTFSSERLPILVTAHTNNMIKRGHGIDIQLQTNKADNIKLACQKINGLIVAPGESFSFWRCVGKTSKANGFKVGRVIVKGHLVAGTGGGLCNLANAIHLIVMHSPMTITELHHHSDALAPDPNGQRTPYSAGTSVNYNFLDFRFRNDTDQSVQICTWCEGDKLFTELRTTKDYPYYYQIVETDHHFHREDDGKYYRISNIYRDTICRQSNCVVKRELKWANHSQVMFDPALIPTELIK